MCCKEIQVKKVRSYEVKKKTMKIYFKSYGTSTSIVSIVNLLNYAFAIRKKTLGPEHTAVPAILNNLAVLYHKKVRGCRSP